MRSQWTGPGTAQRSRGSCSRDTRLEQVARLACEGVAAPRAEVALDPGAPEWKPGRPGTSPEDAHAPNSSTPTAGTGPSSASTCMEGSRHTPSSCGTHRPTTSWQRNASGPLRKTPETKSKRPGALRATTGLTVLQHKSNESRSLHKLESRGSQVLRSRAQAKPPQMCHPGRRAGISFRTLFFVTRHDGIPDRGRSAPLSGMTPFGVVCRREAPCWPTGRDCGPAPHST